MKGQYRHKASGLVGLKAGQLIAYDAAGVRGEVSVVFPYEPTQEQVEILGLTIRQSAEMVYCCEIGQHYHPEPCPMHGMPGSWVQGVRSVDPLVVPLERFEQEWELVS